MKVQFKRNNGGKILMSDIFNWEYIPYKIGDVINIQGLIYRKYINGDTVDDDLVCDNLVKVRDPEWDGLYEVIGIIHNIDMEYILSQNYTYKSAIIEIIKI